MGRSFIFLLAFVASPLLALTNAPLRDFAHRGVLRLGGVSAKSRCSSVFVGQTHAHFYVATALHCLENFQDGGLAVLDYHRAQRRSYISTKVYVMQAFLEDKEIEANLVKLRALDRENAKSAEVGMLMDITVDKLTALSIKIQARVSAGLDLREEHKEMRVLSGMLVDFETRFRDMRQEGRARVLGPPPEDLNLRDEYYSFEGPQNLYYQKLSQEPDLAIVEFSKKEWIHRPSDELALLIDHLMSPVIATERHDDVPVTYVGYGDLNLPREGRNRILIGRGATDPRTLTLAGRFASILGIHPTDKDSGSGAKVPWGEWTAVESGDSGGAVFEGALLRGIMVAKKTRSLNGDALKNVDWIKAKADGSKEYKSGHSESIDLTSSEVQDFLRSLRDQGVPLLLNDERVGLGD